MISASGLWLAVPHAQAQPAPKVQRIGWLIPTEGTTPRDQHRLVTLHAALRELGWVDGKNIAVEVRYAGVNPQRQRELAAELKSLRVALIIANGTITIRAARDGAPGVSIVMLNAGDPVGAGFAASLARPGGDLTGTSAAGEEIVAKQLELLSQAAPKLKRVGVLMNSANPANGFFVAAMSTRASQLDLQLDRLVVTLPDELDAAIASAKGGAMVVLGDPMFGQNRLRIIELAARWQVPAMYGDPQWVLRDGGLMSYLSADDWHVRKVASYVDRILKGAKPADLPVEQPTEFRLVINLLTANALGLTIPQSLLLRADEVIR